MSAIAAIFERADTLVQASVLARLMECLEHRALDGSDVHVSDHVALGHCHFWTTPEEQGEKQPLSLPGYPFGIVFDGRLDNRAELMAALDLPANEAGRFSDAALLLHAYARWGVDCVEHLLGEFAFVIHDEAQGKLICARDPLGDRTLFYSRQGSRLILASEPWAVASVIGSAPELNDQAAAHFFAMQVPENGQTLFKSVYELLPAHVMVVDAAGEHVCCYWQPDFSRKLRGLSDAEYAAQFRALLEESIRCRLRSSSPVGVLMSGGLDSTSVACLAAQMTDQPLTTVSYVFDEFATCDEREYIDAVKRKYSLNSIQIPCDDLWPYRNWKDWPRNPNQPEGNPYRLLKERGYDKARQAGMRVLLTGGFGDHLYSAGEDWLADLLADGQYRLAFRELRLYIRHAGWRWILKAGFIRRLARRMLDALLIGKSLHRRGNPSPWLTDYSIRQLENGKIGASPVNQSVNMLGLYAAQDSTAEIRNSSRHGLELRHPYRDRRLVEFVLALPAYQLFFHGRYKHVLRNAMRGILPESIRSRRQPTSLIPFFFRGVQREAKTITTCIESVNALWRRFVRMDWISRHWNIEISPRQDGPSALVPWFCCSFEAWHKTVFLGYD